MMTTYVVIGSKFWLHSNKEIVFSTLAVSCNECGHSFSMIFLISSLSVIPLVVVIVKFFSNYLKVIMCRGGFI